jgi:peptide deformylase
MNTVVLFLALIICVLSTEHRFGVKIYTIDEGENTLRHPCAFVTKDEIVHNALIQHATADAHLALIKFREQMGFGRAIAAPQVGYSIRMVALNLDGKNMTMFNPTIIETSSETFTMWDDCLSFPDLMVNVRRFKSISISFLDENGIEQTWSKLPQDISELLQHEIDHLNGVLAVDLAEPISKLSNRDAGETSGIVQRLDWLNNKEYYNTLVDFAY